RLSLRADGDIGLDVLQALDQDVFASGAITLNAVATGTIDQPALNGRLQLRNASLNLLDAPNGLSNGNGVIQFNGNQAVIPSLTGETGGGKISLTGFVNYGGPEMVFRMQANADQVHLHSPENVTTTADARLTLAGNSNRSLLSGTVTVTDVALH